MVLRIWTTELQEVVANVIATHADYTAKMVADLDYLSGGRVDFGIGIGWLEEEFEALGMDFSARAARTNEYIAAMKACWGADPVNFSGDTVTIRNAQFNPKPVQGPSQDHARGRSDLRSSRCRAAHPGRVRPKPRRA